ncbi:hypothetical protein [Streptomyces sp. NPDC056527]|uniref:hypothetical protein n=1 Tax=Streptomyces sp. NPDC056527 TaxID=3345853 RepID=UPI0036876F72
MTSKEVRSLIAAARGLLPQEREWEMMNQVPQGLDGETPSPSIPAPYQDFLRDADGAVFGVVALFSGKAAPKSQFYAGTLPDAPVPLGERDWFCIGVVSDDPLFMRRDDGTIWGFPDRGVMWSHSTDFEQWGDDMNSFLLECVFGPGYTRVTGADSTDPWWQVLRALGRVADQP